MTGKTGGPGTAILREADLPLESVMLIIGGMTMVIAGLLLFPVERGALPYYENGLYGLLLITFALQIITLGRTPLGDLPRSRPLFALGILIAALGMTTCFLPLATPLPRVLLFICFGPGGLLLLLQMFLAADKFRNWAQYGGIFRHLIFACASVYLLSILIGLVIWWRGPMTTRQVAFVVLFFGAAILYLAEVLRRIYGSYPEAQRRPVGEVGLSAERSMLVLVGVFMMILGSLLVPVSLGLLPFSASAQLGLLMVIFAVQMLAFGSTPLGPFTRSWLMVVCGLLFAALGIVSCIVPGILVSPLTVLVGVLNLLGGAAALAQMWSQAARRRKGPRPTVPPVLERLFLTQLTLNILAVMFGASMLIPGLVPGVVIGVILAANGGVLLYLLHVLTVLDGLRAGMEVIDQTA